MTLERGRRDENVVMLLCVRGGLFNELMLELLWDRWMKDADCDNKGLGETGRSKP